MKKKIKNALKKVIFSNNKNIIELNLLKKIDLVNKKIIINLILPNPTMHLKEKIKNDILNFLKKEIDIKNMKVEIIIESNKIIIEKKNFIIKNIIAIASGKGGVGKSTIAANIAITLENMGYDVGLLDADIYGPSIPIMFNIDINDPSILYKNGYLNPIKSNYGIKILSIGFFTEYGKAIIWRGPMVTKVLIQFIHDTNWGSLDFLIVDLPPGTGDIHLSLVQEFSLKGVIIVSTSQKIALSDVARTIQMYQIKSIHVPILGIIENMSYFFAKEINDKKYFLFGKDKLKQLSKNMNLSFLGEIPLLQDIQEFSDLGIPVVLRNNNVKKIFVDITKNIINKIIM
ncbi:Mrp/NBP35 family ATP-binding protein [Blattabacterium cuenoti]|uniref:Mrp/NBP35 family ATP-binding protein n=1 Tax=Blattabacterium cuenoti TaxID=1653831 RepID=UPI00163BB296|nr:Mrp/NBP35 family ATP-binding protein [Blattabacterium cuenoti]